MLDAARGASDLIASAIDRNSLYPDARRSPYYIVVPPYVRTSAGIRAMHLLIHWLNSIGFPAYAVVYGDAGSEYRPRTHPDLIAPLLTQAIADLHFMSGRTPIVVCSETYNGTLTNAPFTVRFYGHYPGTLAVKGSSEACDMAFGYSSRLASALGVPDNVLCLPVSDTATFKMSTERVRQGSCFYASKFKAVFGGVPLGLPPGCIEITRDLPESQTPTEIAELFQTSEFFYCFEESALVVEAGLCGCPVVLMKNEHFTNPLGVDDFGWDGFAWGNDPVEMERARQTVQHVQTNYRRLIERFFSQLENFVTKTQSAAHNTQYDSAISLPEEKARPEVDLRPCFTGQDNDEKVIELYEHILLLQNSTSWRITAPLRRITIAVRRLRRRLSV